MRFRCKRQGNLCFCCRRQLLGLWALLAIGIELFSSVSSVSWTLLEHVPVLVPSINDNHFQPLELPISNILLLGQFNYHTPAPRVQAWISVWSKYFTHIAVAGPFSAKAYSKLQNAGVEVYKGRNDRGYVSPIQNLLAAIQQTNHSVDAVLYVHDDALLNLTNLAQGRSKIPTDKIIGTLSHDQAYSYSITLPFNKSSPLIYSSPGLLHKRDTTNATIFLRSMPHWDWHAYCLDKQLTMIQQTSNIQRFATFAPEGLRFFFPARGQSDTLMVPTRLGHFFALASIPHIQHRVFLECAVPTIVLWTLQEEQRHETKMMETPSIRTTTTTTTTTSMDDFLSSVKVLDSGTSNIKLCTSWDFKGIRGTPQMITNCLQSKKRYGLFHPIKISTYTAANFSAWLDRIQQ